MFDSDKVHTAHLWWKTWVLLRKRHVCVTSDMSPWKTLKLFFLSNFHNFHLILIKVVRPFGPGVSLTLCCFVVYYTRWFVVCLSMCHFVLVFFSPFNIAITSLGEERDNLSAFRTFVRFVLKGLILEILPPKIAELRAITHAIHTA